MAFASKVRYRDSNRRHEVVRPDYLVLSDPCPPNKRLINVRVARDTVPDFESMAVATHQGRSWPSIVASGDWPPREAMGASMGSLEDWRSNSCDVGEGFLYGGGTLGLEDLELVEVGAEDRASVLDSFDTVVIRSRCFRVLTLSPTIVIRRHGGVAEVVVQSWGLGTNERKVLKGGEASALVSVVLATRADMWTEPFESECGVLDGYSWHMNVCSGLKRFSCSGVNSAPAELVELLCAISEFGLPLAWNDGEILLSGGREASEAV